MARSLAHRGPDDQGVWVDPDAGVGFGHRRLAIVDLSAAGHQPMHSPSGRYVITYNGEIYNHGELRDQLIAEGCVVDWRGHSDTETLLAGFDHWGIKRTLARAIGMFALGLWDRAERTLLLARDRMGEKPLYYGRASGAGPFLFASELKALREYPGFGPEIDREALALLLRYMVVPAPLSIYRGISKLLPGCVLTLAAGAIEPVIEQYWSTAKVAQSGASNLVSLSDQEATDRLEHLLESAIGRQMTADVPLGAFISGGVDSSTIVAIMQKLSARRVKTFTVGFHESGFNEAEHARAVASHLGTDHTEVYVAAEQAREVIPKLPAIYDEPFADSSQIPTHLISAVARRHVTVALSGDGGDELFAGYDRYSIVDRFWSRAERLPRPARMAAALGLSIVGGFVENARKAAPMMRSANLDQVYDFMLSQWRDPTEVVIGASSSVAAPSIPIPGLGGLDGIERMMARDMLAYLPDDILTKVDRAAMAVSLETRVPLLDPNLVELACSLPRNQKIRGRTTKWALRQVLYRHVPRSLIERPKMGFGIPLESWLRGPLRDWAEALLDEQRLREQGFFRTAPVRKAWECHLSRHSNQSFKLWPILVFQSWLEESRRGADRAAHGVLAEG